MRTIHPDLLGDLGDQMLDVDRRLGIRQLVDDPPGRPERKIAATHQYVSSADPIKELLLSFPQ